MIKSFFFIVVDAFYFGISYMYTNYNTTTDVFPGTSVTRLHGLGIEFDYDHYFPFRNNKDVLAGRNDWGIYFRFGEVF